MQETVLGVSPQRPENTFCTLVKHFWASWPPCAVKTCAVRPGFARVVGELRAADPSKVQGPVKQNASLGEQSEAPRRRWKPGQEQNPRPENQDSQHMLEQPRGSFPELLGILAVLTVGPGPRNRNSFALTHSSFPARFLIAPGSCNICGGQRRLRECSLIFFCLLLRRNAMQPTKKGTTS